MFGEEQNALMHYLLLREERKNFNAMVDKNQI